MNHRPYPKLLRPKSPTPILLTAIPATTIGIDTSETTNPILCHRPKKMICPFRKAQKNPVIFYLTGLPILNLSPDYIRSYPGPVNTHPLHAMELHGMPCCCRNSSRLQVCMEECVTSIFDFPMIFYDQVFSPFAKTDYRFVHWP